MDASAFIFTNRKELRSVLLAHGITLEYIYKMSNSKKSADVQARLRFGERHKLIYAETVSGNFKGQAQTLPKWSENPLCEEIKNNVERLLVSRNCNESAAITLWALINPEGYENHCRKIYAARFDFQTLAAHNAQFPDWFVCNGEYGVKIYYKRMLGGICYVYVSGLDIPGVDGDPRTVLRYRIHFEAVKEPTDPLNCLRYSLKYRRDYEFESEINTAFIQKIIQSDKMQKFPPETYSKKNSIY